MNKNKSLIDGFCVQLIESGFKDVTSKFDKSKGKRRLKGKRYFIVFDYTMVYLITNSGLMYDLCKIKDFNINILKKH